MLPNVSKKYIVLILIQYNNEMVAICFDQIICK